MRLEWLRRAHPLDYMWVMVQLAADLRLLVCYSSGYTKALPVLALLKGTIHACPEDGGRQLAAINASGADKAVPLIFEVFSCIMGPDWSAHSCV